MDDERALRELLEYGLGQAGFAVRSVAEGSAAFTVLQIGCLTSSCST